MIIDVDVLLGLRRETVLSLENPFLLGVAQVRHTGGKLGVEVEAVLAEELESSGLDGVFAVNAELGVCDGAEVEVVGTTDVAPWRGIETLVGFKG